MYRGVDGEAETSWLRRKLAALFPRCQILIRADDRLRHLTISHRLHVGLVVALLVVAGWTLYATAQFVGQTAAMAAKDRQIDDNRIAYRGLLADVATYQSRFYAIAKELEDNQTLMLDLVEQNASLQRSLSSLHASLKSTEEQRDREVVTRGRLQTELEKVDGKLAEVVVNNTTLRERLATAQADLAGALEVGEREAETRHVASRRVEQLERRVSSLRDSLRTALDERKQAVSQSDEQSQRIAMLEERLQQVQAAREDVSQELQEQVTARRQEIDTLRTDLLAALSERDRVMFQQSRMDGHIQALEKQIATIHDLQQDAVQRLSEQTAQHIVNLEKVVGLTGLTVGSLLGVAADQGEGQGGPFVGLDDDGPSEELPGERMVASLNSLGAQIGHWETLQDVMRRMPIAAPLKAYHVTSDFGKRVDPLNKRWAMHYGVDLGGPTDAAVLATAPGVVTFAGWKERYGWVVEIDHGTGIVTRYAHLDSISIKIGRPVEFQQPVGVLGNSGRSTGAHLHYEVNYKGKPMDPMRFIKAGQYVFQDSQGTR